MSTYKHPGVYLEEISTLPPSVAEVSTAIPAFIGYTATAVKKGQDVTNIPTRISTFMEYQAIYGNPQAVTYTIAATEVKDVNNVVTDTLIDSVTSTSELTQLMYHSVDIYFRNGGGPCYIVSVGNGAVSKSELLAGITTLESQDEVTLILVPDAVKLVNMATVKAAANANAVNTATADYFEVCQAMTAQCAKLKDRFAILDVLNLDSSHITDEANFRQGIGANNLEYGAAYYPNLDTSLNYDYQESGVAITGLSNAQTKEYKKTGCIKVNYAGNAATPKIKILLGDASQEIAISVDETDPAAPVLVITNVKVDDNNKHTGTDIETIWSAWNGDKKGFTLVIDGDGSTQTDNIITATALNPVNIPMTMVSVKSSDTGLYNKIKKELARQYISLPPSSAIAGIYAITDRERGVWKAPANVGLTAVIKPSVKVNDDRQDTLNVDENSGKSINVVRNFLGQGTLVWGARTLAGNDNEWRYVSVRRLFNMVEESIQNATEFAVFEPNTKTTWQRVKTTIDSYLYDLWQRGALAGSTAEMAFFVNVGLDTTMTQQDVLEGKMIIEVGLAAVRPAEFIVLRFSHKLQEA